MTKHEERETIGVIAEMMTRLARELADVRHHKHARTVRVLAAMIGRLADELRRLA